ncbi:MAG: NAD(P) transhydrogenase subunit alpha [Pseudomonadota bacterium]
MAKSSTESQEQIAEDAEATVEELREAAEQLGDAAQQAEQASANVESLIDPLMSLAETAGVADWVFLSAIFALAVFVGYYVVWSVTPALHTPLMSVTNAISSVVIVGALIAVGAEVANTAAGSWSRFFGIIAVALASVNIFGGFLVTQRMLAMYKKKER